MLVFFMNICFLLLIFFVITKNKFGDGYLQVFRGLGCGKNGTKLMNNGIKKAPKANKMETKWNQKGVKARQ